MNNGCAVVAKPVSNSLPLCMVGEACMDYGIYYDDWSLLEAWVTDDWDYLCEAFQILNERSKSKKGKKNGSGSTIKSEISAAQDTTNTTGLSLRYDRHGRIIDPDDLDDTKANFRRSDGTGLNVTIPTDNTGWPINTDPLIDDKLNFKHNPNLLTSLYVDDGKGNFKKTTAVTKDIQNLEDEYNGLKYKDMNSVRRWIAIKIARLRQWAKNYTDKIKNMPEKDRKWYQTILSKITAAIKWLSEKAHNLISNKDNQLGEKDDFDYDKYKGWRDKNNKQN